MVSTAIMGTGCSTTTGKSSAVSNRNSSSSFGKVMTASLSSSRKDDVSSKTANKDTNSDKDDATVDKTSTTTTVNASGETDKTQKDTDTASTSAKQVSTSTDTKVDDADSKLEDIAQNVMDFLRQKLGISEEDMEKVMSSLGLTVQDLLKPSNLVMLVTQLSGAQDAGALLTNSDLASNLKDILQFLNQQLTKMSEQTGIPMEDIQKMIQTTSATSDQTTQMIPGSQTQNAPEVKKDISVVGNEDGTNSASDTSSQDAIHTVSTSTSVSKDQTTTTSEDLKNVIAQKLSVTGSAKPQEKQSNLMNGQNQKSGVDVSTETSFANVSANLAQSIQGTFESALAGNAQLVNAADVIRQIVDAVKVTGTNELQSMEIQLNPENLGKINLTVTARNGIVTAQIAAESEQVKRALETQMVTLRENLEKQGVKVDAVEVTVQSHGFEANQNLGGSQSEQGKENRKNTRRHLNLDDLEDLDEDGLQANTPLTGTLVNNSNSSVEYTA